MSRVLTWPVRRPRSALLLATFLTAFAITAMVLRLRPATSLQALLDTSDPAVEALGDVLQNFPVVNELLLMVSLPDDRADVDSFQLLEFARRLESQVASDPEVKPIIAHVRYRAEAQMRQFVERVIAPNGLYYLNDDELAEVKRRLTREGMTQLLARNQAMLAAPGPAAGALAKTLSKDPLRLQEFLLQRLSTFSSLGIAGNQSTRDQSGAFFSPDGRSLLIRVGGTTSPNDFTFARSITTLVQRLAAASNRDGLRLDISGAYAMAAHSATRIQADTIADVVTTIAGLVVLFVIASRRPFRLFWFAFVPVAAGILWGFGAYALIRRTITPLAAVVGGTLGAIGLDYTIHYLSHLQEIRAEAPDLRDAVSRTSQELFRPSLAAWLTSVIGFAAVMISPVRVLRDFAMLGTLCLIGAWLATLLALPAMLVATAPNGADFQIRFAPAAAVGRWISRRSRMLLVCSCTVVAGLIVLLALRGPRFEFESDLMVLHPQPSPPLEAQRRIAQRMRLAGGALIIELHANSPDDLVSLSHDVQQRLDVAPVRAAGITSVFGLSALLPDPRYTTDRAAAIDAELQERIEPELRVALASTNFRAEAFEDYIKFLKTLAAPGPPPRLSVLSDYPAFAQLLLPRDAFEHGRTTTRAVTLILTAEPLETREARKAAVNAVQSALHDLPGATATGTAVIGLGLETAMRRDVPRFVAVALAFIAGYLIVHFRSARLAGMALLPIAVSIVCVIVFISIGGVKLNLLHTVIAPLLLGINLDYGIFAVHAWQSSRNSNELAHHFPAAFSGLIICGGSTIIGFGSLVVTSIPAVKSLGWLINVGVGSCVAATLLMLWPMMLLKRRPDQANASAPSESAGAR